ncbi:MAG: HNH endonuclease [Anaerolineae bacterium]|nr:HNH endonuclease [Anaerolineae bacterium]
MSGTHILPALRRQVRERAAGRCEYCHVHDSDVLLSHQPDHIIAEQHGGKTTASNLALACVHCNRHKGPNIASLDPVSGQLTPLFNPRTQVWEDHFALDGAYILPLTAVGRVTVRLLDLNSPGRLQVRQALIETGSYP